MAVALRMPNCFSHALNCSNVIYNYIYKKTSTTTMYSTPTKIQGSLLLNWIHENTNLTQNAGGKAYAGASRSMEPPFHLVDWLKRNGLI
jgi:hypothetical protein